MRIFLLLLFLAYVHALRYVPVDPATKADVDAAKPLNASGDTGARYGFVFVIQERPAPDAGTLGWIEADCDSTSGLKTHLEFDATAVGNALFASSEAAYGHGPCCLNQHHYVCQIMIREINRCDGLKNELSKYDGQAPTSCPP